VSTHDLRIASGFYTPVDGTLIPTGELKSVADTDLDFVTRAVDLKTKLAALPDGIDHNFVVAPCGPDSMQVASQPGGMMMAGSCVPVATLYEPISGRGLELFSNAPGLQVYTGNFLAGVPGKHGQPYCKHQSVCLESQTFPDSVHHSHFPSPFVSPGQTYIHAMVFRFFTE
jgi:aldose 1-epimerase